MLTPSFLTRQHPKVPVARATVLAYSAIALFGAPFSSASSDLRASALNPLVSTGIRNLGNTCYMNAQLECAFHIPLVRKLVTEEGLQVGAMDLPSDYDEGEVQNSNDIAVRTSQVHQESDARIALRELFLQMASASSQQMEAVTPKSFCLRLGIPPMVQQDSQEFWKLLLPALEQESISDLYKGSFEAYITALDGSGRERRREELFLDLSVDVSKSSTLLDSLEEEFGVPELLSIKDGNGWRPEKGADKVDAHKGSTLIAGGLPPILQFHLKRFSYDWQTESMTKINSRFAFPPELDLSTICKLVDGDDKTKSTVYDLQSVVVHVGKYGMGHYYAYVRPDICKHTWYRFNDHIVEKVTEQEVFDDAYGGEAGSISSNKGKRFPGLGRIFQRFMGGGSTYGYGGETSNAYVIQYVRRKDKSKLYLED